MAGNGAFRCVRACFGTAGVARSIMLWTGVVRYGTAGEVGYGLVSSGLSR